MTANGQARRWMMVEPGKPLVEEAFDPFPPGPGEVVIDVAGCGVCHTDLGYYYDGVRTTHPLPLALGHEISGKVVAAGAGAEAWEGRTVIVAAVIPCGTCDYCARGRGTICPDQVMPGYDIQGGFGSMVTVPASGLCEVDPDRLAAAGLELADVSVIADAVTTPYQAAVQAEVGPGAFTVVNGAGGVGGYMVQIAAALGAHVVAVDVDPAKLERIKGFGARAVFNARDFDDPRGLKKAIQEHASANGQRAAEWHVFECSGTAAGQTAAFGLLNRGATLAVVGFTMDKVEVRLSNLMAFHARALGNWGCPPELYPAALGLVLDGKVQVKPFVERHPLDEINAVFEAVHAGELKRRAILVP